MLKKHHIITQPITCLWCPQSYIAEIPFTPKKLMRFADLNDVLLQRLYITKLVISPALTLLSNRFDIDCHPVKTHLRAMLYRAFTRHSLSSYLDQTSRAPLPFRPLCRGS